MRVIRRLSLAAIAVSTVIACGAPTAPAPPPPAPPVAPDPALPARLAHEVTGDGAFTHLTELQRIADAHGGNRALGTPGYDASVEYVAEKLRAAGYDVQTPEFSAKEFTAHEVALAVDGSPISPVTALEFSPATAAGGVTGPLTVVNGEGCAPEDTAAVTPGSVALVRRGTCTFAVKAANVAKKGAAGMVVANNEDGPLTQGTLGTDPTEAVPTAGITKAEGESLAGRAGATVTLTLAAEIREQRSRNVLAQTRTGNPDEVVMAGAHLDSVSEGPGINDNGTGVAALLETATRMGGSPPVANAVRFAFWGAEEVGLVGSSEYVKALPEPERTRIALYVNLDMVGSPNAGYLVYDGDDSDKEGAGPGPNGSAAIERTLIESLRATGVEADSTDFTGRSDYGPFIAAGIPAGGLFTGAEQKKTTEQAQKWGGTPDAPFDGCYHQACDNIGNLDRTALDRNTDAVATALSTFALSTATLAG